MTLSFLFAVIIAIAVGVQSLIVIALGEIMNLKRWYYYCFGGAFCGMVFHVMLIGKGMFPPLPPPNPGILDKEEVVMLISGFVGGFVYWIVAVGRRGAHKLPTKA